MSTVQAAMPRTNDVTMGNTEPASRAGDKRKGIEESATPAKKGRKEIPQEFESNWSNTTIKILGFPDTKALEDTEKLVRKNLEMIATLTLDQKLSYSAAGEITTRNRYWMWAPWDNLPFSQVNRISNLKAFNEFVRWYYGAKVRAATTTPIPEDVVPRGMLTKAARGLENLRETYATEYDGINDEGSHEEITEDCIRTFVRLSSHEKTIEEFFKSISSMYDELKKEPGDKPGANYNKIIRFSHQIEPFIEALRSITDQQLRNVTVFLASSYDKGYFQKKYLPLLFTCFITSFFAEKENPKVVVTEKMFKDGLNNFCFELQKAKQDGGSDQADQDAFDKGILAEMNQPLFLQIIKEKEIIALKRTEGSFTYYGECLVIAATLGIVGAAAISSTAIPKVITAIMTKGALKAFESLVDDPELKAKIEKLDSVQVNKLRGAYQHLEQLIKGKNENLDEIIGELQKEYEEYEKRGKDIQTSLNWFKEAKKKKEEEKNTKG